MIIIRSTEYGSCTPLLQAIRSFHSSRRSSTLEGASSCLQAHEPTNAKFYASYITSCMFHGIMYIQTPSAQPQLQNVHLTPGRRRPLRSSRTRCTSTCSSLLYSSHSSSPCRVHLTEVWRPGCNWTVSSVNKRHSTSYSGSLFRVPGPPLFSLLANPFLTYPATPARYRQEKANIQHTPW